MRILLKNNKNEKFGFFYNPISNLSDRDLNIAQNDHHKIPYRICFHHFFIYTPTHLKNVKKCCMRVEIAKNDHIDFWGFRDKQIK